MSQPAPSRDRSAPDADASVNSDVNLYDHYASSPPTSPVRRHIPPAASTAAVATPHPPVTRLDSPDQDDDEENDENDENDENEHHNAGTAVAAASHVHRHKHTLQQDQAHSSQASSPHVQDHYQYAVGRHLPQSLKQSALSPSPRSPRPTAPSPLSTSHQRNPAAPNQTLERHDYTTSSVSGRHNHSAAQTTFYSDSSNPSTPEDELPRPNFPNVTKDTRSVSEPLNSKKPASASGPSSPAMEGPIVASHTSTMKPLPRNSSLDTAISAMSGQGSGPGSSPLSGSSSQSSDIAHLIKTAGSPEAVIKYLLKEKQSQSQQNTQLWRLVDKQRAMILGLNKDLEAALKDKERYRRKLKEVMVHAASLRPTTGRPAEGGTREPRSVPRIDTAKDHGANPDSPVLESDGQKDSPVDLTMAPYPITPPADHPQPAPVSGVADVLDPSRSMPKPQEHAHNNYDHEAEDKAEEQARKQRSQERLRELAFNVSLPPSRSLPSEPPKVPPPRLPPGSESPPRKGEAVFKSTAPPRKGPPAPLQLPKGRRKPSPPPVGEESDSESEYDDILKAGRPDRVRRRAHDDDADEEQFAASPEVPSSTPETGRRSVPVPEIEEPEAESPKGRPEAATASLAAVLKSERILVPPMMSPGLPMSPRPMKARGQSPEMPLSPRPPRQPIPLPPGTPLAASSTASSMEPTQAQPTPPGQAAQPAQSSPMRIPKIRTDDRDSTLSEELSPTESSPNERTHIYKGLASDEYPDLLLPPNAIPSIDIKVASSRMKPSRASLLSLNQLEEDPVFTLAVISRADQGELWRVEKDTSSLAKLDQRMKQCPSFTAKTPEKSLFNGHSPAKLDARRQALETYMEELLNTPLDNATALELCKYLSTNTLPPNADDIAVSKLSPDHSTQNMGPDGRATRSGYLTKKGKNFGGWKVRFFVLDGPNLKYYETPGGPHLGTIKLQSAQIGKQSHSGDNQSPAPTNTGEEFDNQYRHAFLILEPKKKDSTSLVKHVLCAEDDRERDLWVEALLQWIDFRDTDDAEGQTVKSAASERQAAEPSGPAKLRKAPQVKSAAEQSGDADPLIGVRYDSTNAGDAPQHVNAVHARPKTAPGLSEQPSLQSLTPEHPAVSAPIGQPKLISGPKDLQLISDASAWGNKLGPPQPSVEDKKQRKRSFFGFGPKTRSSSDGPDTLTGSDSGTVSHGPAFHVGQVFGASLAEAVQYHPPKDVDVPLPSVVYRCIQYLEAKNALNEEGIFRLSGSNIVIKQIRERFNHESDIDLITDEHYYDIHAVASLLKLYLRELPSTILTRELHLDFLNTTEMANQEDKVSAMAQLVQRLPEANLTLLKYLISFLIRIINNSDVNKMTVRNVGIVFSPTLNIPAPVFATLLQNYEGIFGIDPEEYELPNTATAPAADPEHTAQPDVNARSNTPSRTDGHPRHEVAPRPSTSSGSASPHRQPRMEAVRAPARSTPTPPLGASKLPLRQSPTSSLKSATRPAYEPAHLSQQRGTSNGAPGAQRPAYESNHGMEETGASVGPRPPAAYDRPVYKLPNGPGGSTTLAPIEGSNRRRESSIYMGNAPSA